MRALMILLKSLTVLLICTIILLSLVPPVSKDALVHHLALPKLYLKHGGIYEIPSMEFSYYPMNLDLLYLIPLYFNNDIAPKLIHFLFALLTAHLIFRYLKPKAGEIYAWFGVLLFLSIPLIIKLSITAYVDLGLIFFSTAALFLLMKWIEDNFSIKYLVLSAVSCGMAMGTKYNGLITAFLLTIFVPMIYSAHHRDQPYNFIKSAGRGLVYLFITLLIFSPWMIRNWHWRKNPVYPLYDTWFNPDKAQSSADGQSSGVFLYRQIVYHEKGWEMALLPLRVFFQGKDEDPQYFDGRLNPFLLLLPAFAFRKNRGERRFATDKKIMGWFSVLFFSFSFFSTVLRVRYFCPILPPLVVLSVFGIKNLWEEISGYSNPGRRLGQGLVFSSIIVFLSLNAGYVIEQFRYVKPLAFLNGTLTREAYITEYRPEYTAMNYINQNLPNDAVVLLLFVGKRGYYCERDYVLDQNLGQSILLNLAKKSENPDEIYDGLSKIKISHILLHHTFFENWVQEDVNPREQHLIEMFFSKYARGLFFRSGYGVIALEKS
jgi:hypothetical protein